MEAEEKLVKILTKYFSDVLDEIVVETLWVEVIDEEKGWYKIDNVPFYGAEFSCGDVVLAEYDESEMCLVYRKVVEHSGNSTVQVVILEDGFDIESLREEFNELGFSSEKAASGYFVLEIPFDKNYNIIYTKLLELQNKGLLDFAEPVLSEKHFKEK